MYWYDNSGNVLEESDDQGTLQKVYFYLNGAKLAYLQGTSSLYFYYGDHLGTTRMMTDGSGNVCYDADYFPWGDEDHVFTNTCSQNYKFTGKERDPDLGVYNMGARFYQDAMARFYSPDWSADAEPIPYARISDPQSLNLYAYARNNPLLFLDPDGHSNCTPKKNNPGTLVCGDYKPKEPKFDNSLVHWSVNWPARIEPGINYGRGKLSGGCPLGSCHTLNGLYPPLQTGFPGFSVFLAGLGTIGSLPASALTIDDILANPSLLEGMSPEEVEQSLGDVPGWKVEQLGKGSHEGEGWVLRQYDEKGNPTARLIRWHPGGGHHGPQPYWRVSSPEGGKSGIIRGDR